MNWDYKKAGVSIEGGDAWVDVVKGLLKKRPSDPNQVGGVGGFSGLYRIGGGQCLAACCDGVGTKLEVAKLAGSYRGLGQDLVAMNVNDLITCGARPLFFLDYIACGGLDTSLFSEIIEGVLDACEESGCALLGGETAEMPGVYPPSGFDLAGFSVGIVDENKIIDGKSIAAGDLILALPSSGIHSNGFSLVRRVLLDDGLKLPIDASCPGLEEPLGSALLRPTRLYVRQAMAALSACPIHGMAHITGGGLEGNISRVIPDRLKLTLDYEAWQRPALFNLIAQGGVTEEEMRRVFNLGIGYVFIIDPSVLNTMQEVLSSMGETPYVIGQVAHA